MAYTPELSYRSSCTLRRIAWHMGKPMTYAMQWVMTKITKNLEPDSICQACKDKTKCSECPFKKG